MSASSAPPSLWNHEEIITEDYNKLLSLLQQHSLPSTPPLSRRNESSPLEKRISLHSSPSPSSQPSLTPLDLPPPLPMPLPCLPSAPHIEIIPSSLEDDEQVTSLQTLEQLLLQHLHTSGLKKNKEQALVHEFLNLKQLRKQILTKYFTRMTTLSSEFHQRLHWYHEGIQKLIEKQQSIDDNYKKQLQIIANDLREEYRRNKKELQAKYSKHLKELEQKIELIQEKNSNSGYENEENERERREMRRRIEEFEKMNEKLNDKNEKITQRSPSTSLLPSLASHLPSILLTSVL